MTATSLLNPQQRRAALQTLGRDRLISITDHFGLDVGDRRVIENHVSAIVRSRTIEFGDVLALLKRTELQAICDALGIDRSGREKDELASRILDAGTDTKATRSNGRKNGTGEAPEPTASGKLSVDVLERYLWSAADMVKSQFLCKWLRACSPCLSYAAAASTAGSGLSSILT